MTTLQEGSQFAGRYRLVRCIAAGGMGAVYEVIHNETKRKRALKVMHAHFVQSAELRNRFKREAEVAAQIDSEFIVDVFDAGIDEPTQMPFLVMELLKGEELGKRLERVGRFAAPEAITYLWQTALALDKTHQANIVHRDLKPENLFLTQREDGPPRIKVLDFGVAKFVAETGTQGGATRSLGTPLYMAPEQFQGGVVSPASDNFALAMMAYTLIVGEAYWAPETAGNIEVVAFALKAIAGPIEIASVRAQRKGITLPAAFDAWFVKATATHPSQRFPSASASIMALGEVFGLNPARMSGVAASDPLPALNVGKTLPDGSGAVTGGSISAGTVAGTPLDPRSGTMSAASISTPMAPVRRPGNGAAIAVAAGIALIAAAGVGIYFFRKPAAQTTTKAETTVTANAATAPVSASLALPSATASATASATLSATAEPSAEAAHPVAQAQTTAPKPTPGPVFGAMPKPTAPTPPQPTAPPTPHYTRN